jgi:hypothetical protein
VLECTVFHSAHEWLDIFDIFGPTLHTLKFTAFRDAEETLKLLRALQISYDGRNYLPNLKSLSATLDLHPDRSKLVLDILCSRHLRPILSSDSTNNTTTADNASTISSSTTASLDPPPPEQQSEQHQSDQQQSDPPVPSSNPDPNDYTLNPSIDTEYWHSHARLDHATIKCWHFGFDFGERDRKLAKLLKEEAGLDLEVYGQSNRVDWL